MPCDSITLNIVDAANQLLINITKIKDYLQIFGLKLNADKTKYMVLSNPYTKTAVNKVISELPFKVQDKMKLLGITLDASLTFHPHCQMMLGKLKHIAHKRIKLKNILSPPLINNFTLPLVLGSVQYCNTIWGSGSRTAITPVANYLTKHFNLDLKQLLTKKLLTLTYKCLHNLAPTYLSDLILPLRVHTVYSYRYPLMLRTPVSSSAHSQRRFVHKAVLAWNDIPEDIRRSSTLNIFKTRIKFFLQS